MSIIFQKIIFYCLEFYMYENRLIWLKIEVKKSSGGPPNESKQRDTESLM